jgi:hypothetical protein
MTPQEMASVLTTTRDVIDAQNKVIEELRTKNAALSGSLELMLKYGRAVEQHNAQCTADCDDGHNCGWAGHLKRTGRRCGQCPATFKVDVMPTKGSA